jgi:chloramphenicol O-acetyltransferase type A
MAFQPVDLNDYPRKEHFEHFMELSLTYSATVSIDVTDLRAALKRRGLKAYPAQIWMLTSAANLVPEFRMSLDEDGRLGYWDSLSPLYTVFCEAKRSFSGMWTEYQPDFGTFYPALLNDVEQYNDGSLQPQSNVPENVLNVSSIPWVDFTAFNLNLPTKYLLPILTIGKYEERDGKTFMPLSIQVHHAVCDGYHLGLFVEQVRQLAANVDSWLTV